MPDIRKYVENVHVVSGRIHAPHENEPKQYANRGYPYLNVASTRFYQEYAKYASDYFRAEAQGLDPENPTAWETVTLRMADLVKTSAAMQRQFDDYKMILLDRMKYAYIPRGAKFVTMGSTWLCTNPENISGSDGMGVIQRCKAVWNHLDWYGNVLSEPMAVEGTEILRANAPDPQYNMPIVKGYYNVKCQYNDQTSQIDDNTRMILGTSCYVVTGFSDFNQEFTGDYNSVRMLEFTVRKDEINDAVDDRENHVAGGKTFTWDISVTGASVIPVGASYPFTAQSKRKNENVESTETYPISYAWSSSDETVATVDEDGVVTGLTDGSCVITCTLQQNPAFSESFSVAVTAEQTQDVLWFRETPPDRLSAYQSVTLETVLYPGVNTKNVDLLPDSGLYPAETLYPNEADPVVWAFSGADPESYSVVTDGAKATISCWSGSIEPLTVTARYKDLEATAVIPLIGI